ncbi:MAG: multiple sugar transport system substrate-binding protein [Pseudonocardiales bacterium]|jgi:multiple sugar transport system substrate-binding protein|nr:multiple sugar transport system substrate-binding protein [Pseudonocardiales bacterium]
MNRSIRIGLAAALAAALASSACTAGNDSSGSGPSAGATQTITVWHGFTGDNEVNAFNAAVARFHAKYPNITVKAVKGQDDDKITKAISGGDPPDVAVSFTTDNVGKFCASGAWQDLNPLMKSDGVDTSEFNQAAMDYTQFDGKRCALPLLQDVYGLYYNKAMLAQAGYSAPPKTITELTAMAKKLTTFNSDGSIKTAGFIPDWQFYEVAPAHFAPSWDAKWQINGKSSLATDPAWAQMIAWQKSLIDFYGYSKLQKFRQSLGQEFSADNPFEKSKVAMAMDGEWRTASIRDEAPSLDYGTAPFPVADNLVSHYGAGYVTGTIIGIPRGSSHQSAAWQFVKFMTTDTQTLVGLANKIRNVPTTNASLAAATDLKNDPHFKTFLDIAGNQYTSTTPASPNGGAYQVTFGSFLDKYQSGSASNDLKSRLAGVDTQIENDLKLSK